MRNIFYLLILSYPFIAVIPKTLNVVGQVWGGGVIIFILIDYSTAILQKRKLNIFDLAGFFIGTAMAIPILLSGEINITKGLVAIKYITPLLLSSYFFRLVQKKHFNYRKIQNILWIYILFFLGLFFYRYSLINFNFFKAILFREELWYEKSHIIAQMYAAISILFFFFAMRLNNYKLLKYLFLLPLLFMGVRSVMLGIVIFISLLYWKEYSRKNRLLSISIFIIILIFGFQYFSMDKLLSIISSEHDVVTQSTNVSLESFSSGRTLIFDYYVRSFEWIYLFFGGGMQYLNHGAVFHYRLHNDFLEFFFSFGLFGLIVMLFSIHKIIFLNVVKTAKKQDKIFLFTLWIYFSTVSLSTGILDYQSTTYLLFLVVLIKNNSSVVSRKGIGFNDKTRSKLEYE